MSEQFPKFDVRSTSVGDLTVVALVGELDLATMAEALAGLRAAIDTGPKVLLVNLHELEFLDSSGVRILLEARSAAVERNVRLAILNGSGQPHRTLTLVGLDREIEMVGDPSELDL